MTPQSKSAETRRGKREEALRAACEVARDWEIPPDDLLELAKGFAEEAAEQHNEREAAKAAARKRTGLTARDIARIENAGYDYSSGWLMPGRTGEKLRNFDVYASELASEYPLLGLGNPDDPAANYGERLWGMLKEGRVRAPKPSDREILRAAAAYLASARAKYTGEVFVQAIPIVAQVGPVQSTGQQVLPPIEATLVPDQEAPWSRETVMFAQVLETILDWLARPSWVDRAASRFIPSWIPEATLFWRDTIRVMVCSDWEAIIDRFWQSIRE